MMFFVFADWYYIYTYRVWIENVFEVDNVQMEMY